MSTSREQFVRCYRIDDSTAQLQKIEDLINTETMLGGVSYITHIVGVSPGVLVIVYEREAVA